MGSSYSALATADDNDVITSAEHGSSQTHNVPFSGHPIIREPVHMDSVNWLTPVRSGMVISCSSDRTMVLNNMDTGACVMRWRGHDREVTKAIYKHDECKHFVLSASKDSTIRVWYFNSADPCQQYKAHGMAVTALAALTDTKFVSGSRDGCLNIWDMNSEQQPLISTSNHMNVITHIEYEPQLQIICQTSESGSVRLWDSRTIEMICELPPKAHALLHCDICSTSLTCLTSSAGSYAYGSEISMWDLRERKLLKDFRGHEGNVRCSIFLHQKLQSMGNRLLLSVSSDQTARIWNMNNGSCIWKESIPAELNSCVAFSDGSIAIGGSNATLCDLRLLKKAGRPYLYCNSIQSKSLEG